MDGRETKRLRFDDKSKPPTGQNGAKNDDDQEVEEEDVLADLDEDETDQTEPEMMKLLLSSMTDEQRDRYEVVRRSRINPREMQKFLKDIGYQPPIKSCRIILGSIAKLFAGELVEEARDIMKSSGSTGPIQPRHLRKAAQNLKAQRKIPSTEFTHRRLFKR